MHIPALSHLLIIGIKIRILKLQELMVPDDDFESVDLLFVDRGPHQLIRYDSEASPSIEWQCKSLDTAN